ncbi:MAG: hypothetical protein GY832_06565 [Chloroflexi bacterium]|nr:hypothetical protein [Chloroflexota bacterium]
MEFDDDNFLSYALIDNQVVCEGEKGWIAELHRALQWQHDSQPNPSRQ